jgi:hypothetical protein
MNFFTLFKPLPGFHFSRLIFIIQKRFGRRLPALIFAPRFENKAVSSLNL